MVPSSLIHFGRLTTKHSNEPPIQQCTSVAGSLLKLTKPLHFIYFCNPWGFFFLDSPGTRAGQAVITCIISPDQHTALGGIAAG